MKTHVFSVVLKRLKNPCALFQSQLHRTTGRSAMAQCFYTERAAMPLRYRPSARDQSPAVYVF
jgi:hypothetical protein